MVEAEFESIWKQIEADGEAGRLDAGDAAKDEDNLKAEYREIAERRVRLGLLISEVGRRNGIEVAQEEVNRALITEAQQHPGHEREVFEFYQRSPEALASLRAPLFEDKVVDFIVDLAKVSERKMTAAQLRQEIEADAEAEEKKDKKPKKAAAKKSAKKPAKGGKATASDPKPAKKSGAKKAATESS
jgi:trigger factor